jgi:hypothetical protein
MKPRSRHRRAIPYPPRWRASPNPRFSRGDLDPARLKANPMANLDSGRGAGGGVTRRGLERLAIGLTALWLVFWTCAYVIGAPVSENIPSQSPALTLTTSIVLIAVAALGLPWGCFRFPAKLGRGDIRRFEMPRP